MFISWTLIMPSFKKSLIVEQFQGNYLKLTWSKKKKKPLCEASFYLKNLKIYLSWKISAAYWGSTVKTAIKSYGNTDYWVPPPPEGLLPWPRLVCDVRQGMVSRVLSLKKMQSHYFSVGCFQSFDMSGLHDSTMILGFIIIFFICEWHEMS